MSEYKRVSYSYDSVVEAEGGAGYQLDIYSSKDGQVGVETRGSFKTLEEFLEALEGLLPFLEDKQDDDE
jgi:hypothetical protein